MEEGKRVIIIAAVVLLSLVVIVSAKVLFFPLPSWEAEESDIAQRISEANEQKSEDEPEDPENENYRDSKDEYPDENEVSEETEKSEDKEEEPEEDLFTPIRLETPKPLYAIYMTSWVAGTPDIRSGLLELVEETKVNAVVIDIKDETGRVSFGVEDEYLQQIGSSQNRIPDLRDLIKKLNERGVYVIGRISVFQDPYLTGVWPDKAVRTAGGDIWRDRNDLSWVDPGSERVWEYAAAIGWEAYEAGFDELNYDYIRYPTDGRMDDMRMPISEGREKSEVLEEFFAYLDEEFRKKTPEAPERPIISADLFGMTTTNSDDLGIGQLLEKTFPYFDYIAPMVYPSHYPAGWHGIPDPDSSPYDTVYLSLQAAVERAQAETAVIGTKDDEVVSQQTEEELEEVAEVEGSEPSTEAESPIEIPETQQTEFYGPDSGDQLYDKEVYDPNIIRPWLQDFDLGATYTPDMVRAQIDATYDAGLDS